MRLARNLPALLKANNVLTIWYLSLVVGDFISCTEIKQNEINVIDRQRAFDDVI